MFYPQHALFSLNIYRAILTWVFLFSSLLDATSCFAPPPSLLSIYIYIYIRIYILHMLLCILFVSLIYFAVYIYLAYLYLLFCIVIFYKNWLMHTCVFIG